ncbi:translesion error-prone DNA polymerase V autoproteolytic subunit [Brasilonema sp. CT11]|nr:translesion error-prone DNA polymerase V autoproteolytic subunit [Brasilonema sp. CT11]
MLGIHSLCSPLPSESCFSLASEINHPSLKLPLFGESVQAGFPSPADDWLEDSIDLNQKFVKNPAATILLRVAGDSMQDAGIFQGDFVVVDRSVEAKPGRIVVAAVNGEFTLKRLSRVGGKLWLMPENPDYTPIEITDEMEVMTMGVVVSVIRQL